MKRLCTIAFFACGTWILPRSVPAQLRGPELDLAIHQYLQPLVALRTFSGVMLLARGDSLLIERAYGLADAEHSVPMTT